jgi:T5orf172 domain
MSVKTCCKCETEFPLEAFYKRKGGHATHSYCKACQKQYMKDKFSGGLEDEPGKGALYICYNSRIPGEVKVGAAKNPLRRVALMERAQNYRLHVPLTWPGLGHLESEVHRVLEPHRVTQGLGREWFACSLPFAWSAVTEVIAQQNRPGEI